MRAERTNYYFPIGLFLAIFLDGGLTQIFAKYMFTSTVAMESRLVLLWIVMAICYGKVEHLVFWSAIAGLIYDIFYTGILGVFTTIFPLIVYVTNYAIQFITRSFIVILLVYLIDATIVTVLFFWANLMVGFTDVAIADFISRTLGPTLIYNIAWFIILFIPLKHLFELSH